MGLRDFVANVITGRAFLPAVARRRRVLDGVVVDNDPLDERRDGAEQRIDAREAMIQAGGIVIDTDDNQFRPAGVGQRFAKRDLTPIQQDRMLEIAWFLMESNPFAKRLIELMKDLIVGEGVSATSKDAKTKAIIDQTWKHPVNRLDQRIPELYRAFSLNGELCLPVARNPITGIPQIGYIDPLQILRVETRVDNVLIPETVVLKHTAGQTDGARLKIVQEDPVSGLLDGACFYFRINALPNSTRGRSDLLTLADWLDLYDQLMFSEVERVRFLSSYILDLTMEDADDIKIKSRMKALQSPAPGTVFGHNQKETLKAVTPQLNATDRSKVGEMLAIHIAGSIGFPISWLGFTDSNRATMEGQNDVMMKTPASRQKEFAAHLGTILRYAIEGATTTNRALYRDVTAVSFDVLMPEIAAKDIARVGTVLASVMAALDSGMANRTMSRRAAATVIVSLLQHLGVALDVEAVMAEADQEHADAQDAQDARAALIARATAARAAVATAPEPVAP